MARIRTVKPELFRHEGLYDLETELGIPVRLAWIGLFTIADREGRFKWRPRAIKAEVLPYDDVDFSRVLDALVTRGFLVRYTHAGNEYGWITVQGETYIFHLDVHRFRIFGLLCWIWVQAFKAIFCVVGFSLHVLGINGQSVGGGGYSTFFSNLKGTENKSIAELLFYEVLVPSQPSDVNGS